MTKLLWGKVVFLFFVFFESNVEPSKSLKTHMNHLPLLLHQKNPIASMEFALASSSSAKIALFSCKFLQFHLSFTLILENWAIFGDMLGRQMRLGSPKLPNVWRSSSWRSRSSRRNTSMRTVALSTTAGLGNTMEAPAANAQNVNYMWPDKKVRLFC